MSPGGREGNPPDFKRAQGPVTSTLPARSSSGAKMPQAAFSAWVHLSSVELSLRPSFCDATRWDSYHHSPPPPFRESPSTFTHGTVASFF